MDAEDAVHLVQERDHFYSLLNFTSMLYSILIPTTIDMNAVTQTNLIIYVIIVGLS
jgi:hypothetical protein